MTLVAGCYERFLFGFTYPDSPSADGDDAPALERTFTHAAHKGVVKSLAAAGQYMASGGADDLIHLFDMKEDKDLGFLMNPGQGAVTALRFFAPSDGYSPTHLLAGCSDGTISVWRAGGGWECMRTLRGHRAEVTGIAVHPSGRVALTTARDNSLRLWDLVKGRATFTTKVEGQPEGVEFAPSGANYALRVGTAVVVRPVGAVEGDETATVRLEHPRPVISMAFGGEDGVVVTGTDDGALRVWDAVVGRVLLHIPKAHAVRIKAIAALPPQGEAERADTGGAVPEMVATASSDGVIKVWLLRQAVAAAADSGDSEAPEGGGEGARLCQTETRARLTTLCAVDSPEVMAVRQREEAETRVVAAKVKKHAKRKSAAVTAAGGGDARPMKKKEEKEKRVQQQRVVVVEKSKLKEKESDGGQRGVERRRDGVVSFVDEKDAERQSKKARKVKLSAQRAAEGRGGKKRRASIPGEHA